MTVKRVTRRILSFLLSAAILLSAGCNASPATETSVTTAAIQEEADTSALSPDRADESISTDAPATEPTVSAEGSTGEGEAPSQNEEKAFYDGELNPAVWRVTDPESGNSMDLMGTIHLVPDSETVVPDYVMELYRAADGIAVEYDTTRLNADLVLQLQYLSYFTLSDGTTIDDHLSPETLERASEYLSANGYDPAMFAGYNAAYWQSLVSNLALLSIPGIRASGVDVYFIANAKKDGKEVRNIEALETQMNVLTMLGDEFYEWQIDEMLDELDEEGGQAEIEEAFRLLYTSWATGDEALYAEAEEEDTEEMPEEFTAEYEAYTKALGPDRNVGMAEKAAEYIRNGDNLLFMVGFAHFCGEGSVLDNLREMGFTVEKIY
ncbi:MAG: TraB/GumN family protein [Bacteroides sp.]|nr:TraB/GumN family protein [Eubacterium sp.]MCM1419373.1 TraB/GumN family protein [Roseburia sp.]MCM1463024.1 TraB/GumN family protein [Bacteroides sp.]